MSYTCTHNWYEFGRSNYTSNINLVRTVSPIIGDILGQYITIAKK